MASAEAGTLAVPKVYGHLEDFVAPLDAVLNAREGSFPDALGNRTKVHSVADWASYLLSAWLNALVAYLSRSDVRAAPDEAAPRAVRALLRRLDVDVLAGLRREHHVDILVVLEPTRVDARRMKIAGVVGPNHTNVSGQVACGLFVGRRMITQAEVLVG